MRFIHVATAVGIAIAVLFIGPAVLMGAPARADLSGYGNCVGSITEVPLWEHDYQNQQLIGVIEQDLNSGVSPAAEAHKVSHMGFDPRLANRIVECVIQEHP
jgi:glycerol dehydrogenase-like iron-containing ADH family enzyme